MERRHFQHPRLTQQELAAAIGLSQRGAGKREERGVRWLVAWCRAALAAGARCSA